MESVNVLDKGFVRLVDSMGNDSSVVRSARVSYGDGTKTPEKDRNLIKYLMKHKHTSPFESVVFTFHVKAPIFVARQWMRHRTWSYNEYSLRYSEAENDFYTPSPNTVLYQHKVNKQGRDKLKAPVYEVQTNVANMIAENNRIAWDTYQQMIKIDISREIARMVLPVTYYTQFYGTVNLRNLLHFMELRSAEDAQWEIRQYSQALEYFVQEVCPVSYEAWKNH